MINRYNRIGQPDAVITVQLWVATGVAPLINDPVIRVLGLPDLDEVVPPIIVQILRVGIRSAIVHEYC